MTDDPAQVLTMLWAEGTPLSAGDPVSNIPRAIREAISNSVNSNTKSYRYVLLTQLLAKLTRPEVDSRAVQEGAKVTKAFDARTFCRRYIVPFDRGYDEVLGGSTDPYVNNPLRIPSITADHEAAQKNRAGFADLRKVLDYAESHIDHVEDLLRLVLAAISDRLARTRIVYPTPNRVALTATEDLVNDFLAERTGGRRLQAIAAALFDTIGERFNLYEEVRAGHINKSDAARGDVADLDCVNSEGFPVLNVEVKDRRLSIHEVQDTIRVARERGVMEILYLIRGGVEPDDADAYQHLKAQQFTAGHNLYEMNFATMLRACLILFGEVGRRSLLQSIGTRIDAFGELTDRQAWRDGLESI